MDVDALAKHISERLVVAIESFQDEEPPHDVPSPSGVYGCIRQQVFVGRRIPRTNRIPAQSIKKMEAGRGIESFWQRALKKAGFTWAALGRIQVGDVMTGEGDGLVFSLGDKDFSNTTMLTEFKDMGLWPYLYCIDGQFMEKHLEYYFQVQSYMEAYNFDRCLFIAGPADYSGAKWAWSKIKRKTTDLPPFYVRVIERNPEAFKWANERAKLVKSYLDSVEDAPFVLTEWLAKVPREADPANEQYPCTYCGWAEDCLKIGGTTIDREVPNFS
jgi:hypothetical protein